MKIQRSTVVSLILLCALLLPTLVMALRAQPVQASPLDAPTPVSSPSTRASSTSLAAFSRSSRLTASARSAVVDLSDYNLLDLQWVITMGTVNTTTLKLQYSNDGQNWADGVSVATLASSTGGMNQFNNFGRYTAVYATLTNSSPITITLVGLAK